jgi:hypothetical protein
MRIETSPAVIATSVRTPSATPIGAAVDAAPADAPGLRWGRDPSPAAVGMPNEFPYEARQTADRLMPETAPPPAFGPNLFPAAGSR